MNPQLLTCLASGTCADEYYEDVHMNQSDMLEYI